MRYMVIVKQTPEQEAAGMPPDAERMFADMAVFNDALIAAGIMVDGAGLKPTKFGKKVRFTARGEVTVIDGPFTETKELIGGYWVWRCKDMDEVMSWVRRIPFDEGEVEVRPYQEPEDFEGTGLVADEVIEQEKGWREDQMKRAPKAG